LQTDYIDVYYAHADDPSTPVEETLAAFDALIRAGKVRTIGASNFEADRLSQALALADEKELPRFIAIQPHYNLIEREYEGELREVGDREKLGCVPYFSLASGFLTGKFRPGGTAETRRGLHSGETHLGNADSVAALEVLLAVADELEAPPAAVALAWLGEQPTVTAPIASARSVDQLEDLLAMVDVSLNDDQRLRLNVSGGQGK
jgi:aryl-alcohol dehydrogenase-like predicted oxidoreductase